MIKTSKNNAVFFLPFATCQASLLIRRGNLTADLFPFPAEQSLLIKTRVILHGLSCKGSLFTQRTTLEHFFLSKWRGNRKHGKPRSMRKRRRTPLPNRRLRHLATRLNLEIRTRLTSRAELRLLLLLFIVF